MLFGCYGSSNDKDQPHPSCTLVVDGTALANAGTKPPSKYPEITPCEKRIPKDTSEGMLVLDGKLWAAHGIRLSPPAERQHQRWTARLFPIEL